MDFGPQINNEVLNILYPSSSLGGGGCQNVAPTKSFCPAKKFGTVVGALLKFRPLLGIFTNSSTVLF